ncbi:hypothetical protein HPB51_028229 [Rhipicephalus microplus]|uniref:PDZ domain-containing protein n=1 Tax=Rhipicephalus microplus TaxID=6941 RepID=A0A9J6CXI7_RHIMP|nr:hypothetical protein HPB51_028229 [Rhipicephalus microplus]
MDTSSAHGSPPACVLRPPKQSSPSTVAGTSTSGITAQLAKPPAARLCHLVRRPEYDGYGFKLIPAKQRYLPRVSAIEPGSPAEAAGLRSNDTVVEVNGVILEGLGHEDVVQLVKSTPNEARLLVVDDETAAWYRRRGIALRGDNLNVVRTSSKKSSRKVRSKGITTSGSINRSSGSLTSSELAGGLRLCYLRKWPDYEGYGFSLREDEENFFITAVVPDSPAELGGLRNDDRLIEVNAVSVENRSYQEIMCRIGKEPDQVNLLVIDRETDEAFASRQQKPSGQADGVLRRWTPARRPRLTFMKTKKQTPKVEAAGNGGFVIPHAVESANDAEHDKAISEEDLVVKEGVAKSHWRPHLPATQSMFLNCASPIPTPRKDNTSNSGYSSISVGSSETMSPTESADGLRLCHLSKWPNFEGYGFALKAKRLRDGQFVAHVDLGSPAHLGGLRKRDRIVEVNGESVEGASYRDVVNRIKLDPGNVALLVIDRETDEAFAHQNRTPNSRDDCVVECRTPPVQPPPYPTASG